MDIPWLLLFDIAMFVWGYFAFRLAEISLWGSD